MSWLCTVIWNTAERRGVNLGRFAPWIFGGMIGSWPKRVRR